MIAAATLTCEFLSFNSFEMVSISSGSSTASKGGVGPLDLSSIIPVGFNTNIKQLLDEVEHDIMKLSKPRSVLSAEAEG